MLPHPTHERLITLGLIGMAKALEEQRRSPDLDALSFEERVGLLAIARQPNETPNVSRRARFARSARSRTTNATRAAGGACEDVAAAPLRSINSRRITRSPCRR